MYHIALAGDENYLKFLAVCINSIVVNTDRFKTIQSIPNLNLEIHGKDYIQQNEAVENFEEKYIFHILTDQISTHSRENFEKLEKELNKTFPLEIIIHVIPVTEFIGLRMWRNSYLAYFRLVMNRILPKDLTKILYLDGADTLVNCDIRELFSLDLQDCFSAVVQNTAEQSFIGAAYKTDDDNFKNFYFNSGVLLINLIKWRSHNIEKESLEYVKNNNLAFPDQDVLNKLFGKEIISLPYTWNMMINKENPPKNPIIRPKINHFAFKPWKSSPDKPFWVSEQGGYYYPDIDLWWKIALETPYFCEDLKAYSQSNSYLKKVRRQAKLEKIFSNKHSFQYVLYKFNKKLEPYLKKLEKFLKFFRTKIRNHKLKKRSV